MLTQTNITNIVLNLLSSFDSPAHILAVIPARTICAPEQECASVILTPEKKRKCLPEDFVRGNKLDQVAVEGVFKGFVFVFEVEGVFEGLRVYLKDGETHNGRFSLLVHHPWALPSFIQKVTIII